MCHRIIPSGEYRQRNADRSGPDVMMILVENADRELQLTEMPDGSISMDTCINCYTRMALDRKSVV